ncbi:MAG: hypothetical protein EXS31_09550 [Pedosphaera sp.]|nr:hypothetical protein [Pedosphaera sp.]
MKYPRNVRVFRGQFDAAPFAGVLFLLVILLLLLFRVAFTAGVRLDLDLPTVSSKLDSVANRVAVVALDASGQLYYENTGVQDETALIIRLKETLRQTKEPITLVIQADRMVTLDRATRLIGMARSLGFKDALFSVRQAAPPSQRVAVPRKTEQ